MKKLISFLFLLSFLFGNSQQFQGLTNINGKILCSEVDSANNKIYIGGYFPTLGNIAVSSDGGMTFQQYASTNDTVFDLKISQKGL
jgi:hypothetical protein